ncbi:unnamed protein product [Caenorhabditis nigoni]
MVLSQCALPRQITSRPHLLEFVEDVESRYHDLFGIKLTDSNRQCLAYDLHPRRNFNPLYTVIGIAESMKKHHVLKIILIVGQGHSYGIQCPEQDFLKQQLLSIFNESTEFTLTKMENEGRLLLKQITKKKSEGENDDLFSSYCSTDFNNNYEDYYMH